MFYLSNVKIYLLFLYIIIKIVNFKVMSYLFTSESVSSGHPDKVADQISDAILDEFLKQDKESKVACETLCTTGLVVVNGEIKSNAYVDIQKVVRDTIEEIGYNKSEYQFDSKSCGVISTIHEQSPDINQGVEREKEEEQGAGDQGIMFGYATNETAVYMPATLSLSHLILKTLEDIRKEGKVMTYLRPDSKSQVTIEYDEENNPLRIDTIVVSTQHDDWVEVNKIKNDVKSILIPRVIEKLKKNNDRCYNLFNGEYKLYVNPTGKFVIGGPHGDTGLTGRKIIVDTYGGHGAHGGGAFCGKDPSKVDRSAAYMARYLAKNIVAAGIADKCLIQLSYAIGVAEPISMYINTYNKKCKSCDAILTEYIKKNIDLRPAAIIKKFGLKNPIYKPTATYGHFGRTPYIKEDIEYFAWEKLDLVEDLKKVFK